MRGIIGRGHLALHCLSNGDVLVHGLILFVIGGLLKQDWAIISVASNANIGGATSAGVLATAIGRGDLRLPGILAGSLGNAVGTYAGVFVALYLR